MNCGDTRECLYAFLDNELDTPLSMELQRHLDGCGDCAREAEIERTVRARLVHVMGSGCPALDEELIRGVCEPEPVGESSSDPRRRIRGAWRRFPAAAAVLGLVVGGTAWLGWRGGGVTKSHGSFAELLVADFEHFLDEGSQVQVASRDRHTVENWLFEKTSLRVALPVADDPDVQLLGGRKCKIDGKPAAFAVYDIQGEPASVVAVDAAQVALETMTEKRHDGSTHWVDRRRGFTVVACRRDGLVYGAVSTLPESVLLALMTGPGHSID